jgi:predicted oxidoreductase
LLKNGNINYLDLAMARKIIPFENADLGGGEVDRQAGAGAVIAEMLANTAERVAAAIAEERARVIAWGRRHPDMPLSLAVQFLAQGEHLK